MHTHIARCCSSLEWTENGSPDNSHQCRRRCRRACRSLRLAQESRHREIEFDSHFVIGIELCHGLRFIHDERSAKSGHLEGLFRLSEC